MWVRPEDLASRMSESMVMVSSCVSSIMAVVGMNP